MSDKANAAHRLYREIEAAKVLLAQFADILGDDAEARQDMVEGQTNLREAIEKALARLMSVEGMLQGMGAVVDNLESRISRLNAQRENLRTSIAVALELAEIRKLETALGTLTLKAVPARCEITDEALIPAKYWAAQDPRLDKKALLAALKDKEIIPGASLSNGGMTLQIGYK